MKHYHCLVAGLPEIRIDDNKLSYSLESFKEELQKELSQGDFAFIDLFYRRFDNSNLLLFLKDTEAALDSRGTIKHDDFVEIVQLAKEVEEPQSEKMPSYFKKFIPAYLEDKPIFAEMSWEDQLTSLYNDDSLKCNNKFISSWFEFNLGITNILTAINCKNHDIPLESAIVGNNEVAMEIRGSNSKDFGISAIFPLLEDVLRIAEESNLLERERRVDMLKWKWIEDNAFFNYFTIEKVFAYLLQLDIIERWINLSEETGSKVFRELAARLQGAFEFPDDYKLHR